MSLVDVTRLELTSADRSVLADCSLTIRPGERVGLVGRSGSGKTALAHALFGHTRTGIARTGGSVRVAGHDPFTAAGARRVRGRAAAYVPQDCASALPAERRIGWLLDRAARRAGVPRAGLAPARDAVMGSLGLDPGLARAFPHQVSGGQAQRVALATALLAGAELLVLDEPTSGLDPRAAADLVRLLRRGTGAVAMLLISHDHDIVAEVTTRRLAMEKGGLAVGPSDRPARPFSPPAPAPAASPRRSAEPPRPGGAALLRAEGITAGHGAEPVLRGTDLELRAGECVAVMGPSGVGKTTLARVLAGGLAPDAGRLWLREEPCPWPVTRRRGGDRLLVAHVDQDSRGALNPRETVAVALRRARRAALRRGLVPEPAAELLRAVALPAASAGRVPGELSGGERQRVNLARALAAAPQVLLCDEVTASLDPDTERRVLALLAELRTERDLAVLLITHSAAVAATADRVLELRHGLLVPAVRHRDRERV
ncbi:ABC transporter ATP-binding protein [Streptomyces lonarensis]|uniref:ABC transporter ATP-binding protein n=1 Tax=Streptomyces lonarensis TaxID=700599 RepID=A0A7X6HYS8_9ACTN|nr:ATP-binding cassette domain-containing protein [Streptomyces lonarensis]NJQ05534.1 ABC transporter ATP-binding protein [Streptomyces lonarensis]